MKKLLGIVVLGLLLSGNAYAGSHNSFSSLNGYYKAKCVTNDRSYITTIEIDFNGANHPPTKYNNDKAFLVDGPPFHENFKIVYDQKWPDGFWTYILKFDSILLIGDIESGFRKSKFTFLDQSTINKSKVECVKLIDTVSISGTEQDGTAESSGSSGTAFFVSNRGHLLTNNHVVEGCSISKITYKNKDYDTKLLATDKTLDLALLKAELRPKSFFNFSKDNVKKLNKVYVAGYPLGKGLSDDLKISSGIVSSLKGFQDNSNEIQIDAPINPGNSGGPIINENGDLVAIAVSGLAKDQTEGINFGIKASSAELFLKSNKVEPKKSMYAGIKDNDKLLEILEEGTVYTYCN